eukprot:scaffold2053_cov112-Cylindrotheca_fusiformis.AAC.1
MAEAGQQGGVPSSMSFVQFSPSKKGALCVDIERERRGQNRLNKPRNNPIQQYSTLVGGLIILPVEADGAQA